MLLTEFREFALPRHHAFIFFDFLSILTVDAFWPDGAATKRMVLAVVSEVLGKKTAFSSRALQHVMYQTFLWFLRSFAHYVFLSNPKL